jgi:predicted dehydrogenase
MAIHNVDEILWITGRMPVAALAVGSRVYGHRQSTCDEDFDDAMLHMWFEDEIVAQVQVSRNHVSGYRVETVIYGEEGQIQIGRFAQRPEEVTVAVYGRRLRSEPKEARTFSGEPDRASAPEFVPRFRHAYLGEVEVFVRCCAAGDPFPVNHRDAVHAQTVISTGMQKTLTRAEASPIAASAAGADRI